VSVCPVCGKGETDYPARFDYTPVSHLACVEKLEAAAARAAAFVLPTGYDEDLALKMMTNAETYGFAFVADREYKRAESAEREAAFWKWLWHQSTQTIATDGFDKHPWIAHMRERWERET
jgi:hypothetical protein